MSVPPPVPGPLRRAALLRAVLLALLTLALAVAAPAAGATASVPQPALTAEAESTECGGDGEIRAGSRRELPVPVTPHARRTPLPRALPPAPAMVHRHAPAAPSRTTVLRC
ncbi:hypothetical protein H9Y04_15690 [Streptomyces sp. TRM66268-LWL]|uniref:Secreted protein n=1 Tax=Streptomyces polyasparticus TaxID=2767826 RepID=A0ABR7SGM1_9ACTN|nr:hypothetical protein [Streptomyces polyasparticus]MBC9714009.1 hypothetical protein [Streptomyces polyasparticus]